MQPDILICSHVRKSFTVRNQRRTILSDISLSLSAGEILTITGRSGTGKSTLLSILSGLEIPDCGDVLLFDTSVRTSGESKLARLRHTKTGFLFQNHNLISSWTAFENVEAALAHRQLSDASIQDSIKGIFNELGLAELTDYLPAEMSAGEQQRVALARAVVHRPELLFVDVPVADVDPETGYHILNILKKIVLERKTAIVFVTHGQPPSGFDSRVMELTNGILEKVT
jgi:putative ABC transport system ATP-binding protein